MGEVEEAVSLLRQAQRLHPGDFWINVVLAGCLLDLKFRRYEEAIRYYSAALALRPDSPAVHCNIGFLLHKEGDFDGAIASYNATIRLSDGYSLAYNNRGNALHRKGQEDKAIADFEHAIRLDPQFAIAFYNRGEARYRKMEYAKAIADYNEAIRIEPKYADAHNSLAWVLSTCPIERFRDGAMAVRYAENACKLSDYKDFFLLDTLGAAYAENRQFEMAVETQKRVIALLLLRNQNPKLRDEVEERRRLYIEKKPYRVVPE